MGSFIDLFRRSPRNDWIHNDSFHKRWTLCAKKLRPKFTDTIILEQAPSEPRIIDIRLSYGGGTDSRID